MKHAEHSSVSPFNAVAMLALSGVLTVSAPEAVAVATYDQTLSWDASPTQSVTGYRLYDRPTANSGIAYHMTDVGKVITATISLPDNGQRDYYLTAYDSSQESAESNHVQAVPRYVAGSCNPHVTTSASSEVVLPTNITFHIADFDCVKDLKVTMSDSPMHSALNFSTTTPAASYVETFVRPPAGTPCPQTAHITFDMTRPDGSIKREISTFTAKKSSSGLCNSTFSLPQPVEVAPPCDGSNVNFFLSRDTTKYYQLHAAFMGNVSCVTSFKFTVDANAKLHPATNVHISSTVPLGSDLDPILLLTKPTGSGCPTDLKLTGVFEFNNGGPAVTRIATVRAKETPGTHNCRTDYQIFNPAP